MSAALSPAAPPSWKGAYLALIGLLARRRKELDITQPALAAQLGKSLATLQRWEDGTNPPPAMDLFQWAAVLGVDITSNLRCSGDGQGKALPITSTIRSPGIAEFANALPLTERGKEKLADDIAAAEAMMAECARDGSFGGGHPMARALGLFVYLTDKGWPPHFAAACAMAETDAPPERMLMSLGSPPDISALLQNPEA